MKFLIALCLLALANGQEDLCQECQAGVAEWGAHLQVDHELVEVEQGLIEMVCSTLDETNAATCSDFVLTWWPSIVKALFEYEGTIPAICGGIGDCTQTRQFRRPKHVRLFFDIMRAKRATFNLYVFSLKWLNVKQ